MRPDANGQPDMDLRGIKCPLNFVKAKLFLEKQPELSRHILWLDAELTMNVAQSLRQEGYEVETKPKPTLIILQVTVPPYRSPGI